MYLKLTDKISPRHVASILRPDIPFDEIEWDYENIYEWVFVTLPNLSFSLDVTRDHGQGYVDDELLDQLSDEEIQQLPRIGPTYIYGYDRALNSFVDEIEAHVVQQISDALGISITVYSGRINIEQGDPNPIRQIEPKR